MLGRRIVLILEEIHRAFGDIVDQADTGGVLHSPSRPEFGTSNTAVDLTLDTCWLSISESGVEISGYDDWVSYIPQQDEQLVHLLPARFGLSAVLQVRRCNSQLLLGEIGDVESDDKASAATPAYLA